MVELAFTVLAMSFLGFLALECHRVLTESAPMQRRLLAQTRQPIPVRVTVNRRS